MTDIQNRVETVLSARTTCVHNSVNVTDLIQELTAREASAISALEGMFDNTEWINGKMSIGIPSRESFKNADATLEQLKEK